ncbi:MAG: hypothetical protein GXP55_01300, partial [Deltaproteobacteria bacterium]|nr:hypothetical protein [Deltaproteobacteria bacterium]
VGVGTGVVFALLANGARSDARAACAQLDGARVCSTAARGPLNRDRRDSLVADISLGLGVAAAITGLVLLLRDRSTREAAPAVVPEAVVTRTRVELRLHARF